jgi:hypothetical protein
MTSDKYVYPKLKIFSIIQQTIDSGRINCKIQKESHLSEMHSKKHKRFGIKMYELCDRLAYTYEISVYPKKKKKKKKKRLARMLHLHMELYLK